jgi:hypothetical protein
MAGYFDILRRGSLLVASLKEIARRCTRIMASQCRRTTNSIQPGRLHQRRSQLWFRWFAIANREQPERPRSSAEAGTLLHHHAVIFDTFGISALREAKRIPGALRLSFRARDFA